VPTAQGHQYRDGTKSNSAYRVAEGHLTGSGDLGLPSKKGRVAFRIHGNAMPSVDRRTAQQAERLHYGNDTKAENRRPTVAHVEDRRQQAGACTHAIAPAYISVLSDSSLSRVTASALAVWWLAEKTHFRSSLRITLADHLASRIVKLTTGCPSTDRKAHSQFP